MPAARREREGLRAEAQAESWRSADRAGARRVARMRYGDRSATERCLRAAARAVQGTGDRMQDGIRKAVVNLAFTCSPELADALASTIDDDPARTCRPAHARREKPLLDLQRSMTQGPSTGHECQGSRPRDYADVCWRLLGDLVGGQRGTLSLDRARSALRAASLLPLPDAYPILAWHTENAVRRLRSTEQAPQLASLLRAYLAAADLAQVASSCAAGTSARGFLAARAAAGEPTVFSPGEAERAQGWLRLWIRANVRRDLLVCDPYFGPTELWLLRVVAEEAPEARVRVLGSIAHHRKWAEEGSTRTVYERHWQESVSREEEPPQTEFVLAGVDPRMDAPIHDRFLVADSACLCVGGSLNGLGARSRR